MHGFICIAVVSGIPVKVRDRVGAGRGSGQGEEEGVANERDSDGMGQGRDKLNVMGVRKFIQWYREPFLNASFNLSGKLQE